VRSVARLIAMMRASARYDESALEAFEERAAIMEHCGGLPRDEAELRAFCLAFGAPHDDLDRIEREVSEILSGRGLP